LEECYVYESGDGKPISNMDYSLEHGQKVQSGTTDSSGETAYAIVSSPGETTVSSIKNMSGGRRG
jgi:hypothetical protein